MSSAALDSSQRRSRSAAATEPRRSRRLEIRSPAVAEASPFPKEVALRSALQPSALAPRRNRYAVFAGNLLHGVLDARGRTPGRPLSGPAGRLRVTLVVNYWERRPTDVPTWNESGIYRSLRR